MYSNPLFSDALSAVATPTSLAPFLTGIGGNLATAAAAAAAANGAATPNNATLLGQTIASLQFPQLGLLNLTSVILVSNLDENVRNFFEKFRYKN